MDIIGYAYEADHHCIDCAQSRTFKREPNPDLHGQDANGIPYDAIDNERNPIHPMFSTDEHSPHGEYCRDCHKEISEPWLSDGYELFNVPDDYEPEAEEPNTTIPNGWYWWSCQPECLPDGEAIGPFDTEQEALIDCVSGINW